MTIAKIISAIGNNNSVYPLLVRDCGIEIPVKVVMTYNQNKEESKNIAYLAARERILDEYATSAVWLGGIPLIGNLCDKILKKKGFNPDVNPKLFKEETLQGLNYNINKFKDIAPQAVQDLLKVKNNKKTYQKLLAGKFLISTSIPILFMGFILPKMIFASSARKIAEQKRKEKENAINFTDKSKFISFKGIEKIANFTTQDKMAVTDGGYAIGRVLTARNRDAAYDVGFKMLGMMFLNFVAPKWIEKFLDNITKVKLDPIILADKEFEKAVKSGSLSLPKSEKLKDLLEFIDNPANKNSLFVKYADKFGKIRMLSDGIRDPRAYVSEKELGQFTRDIKDFFQKATDSGNIKSCFKKAKFAKSLNILTNVGLSSFLLAYVLPKCQFAIREKMTGSTLEPGLAPNA